MGRQTTEKKEEKKESLAQGSCSTTLAFSCLFFLLSCPFCFLIMHFLCCFSSGNSFVFHIETLAFLFNFTSPFPPQSTSVPYSMWSKTKTHREVTIMQAIPTSWVYPGFMHMQLYFNSLNQRRKHHCKRCALTTLHPDRWHGRSGGHRARSVGRCFARRPSHGSCHAHG